MYLDPSYKTSLDNIRLILEESPEEQRLLVAYQDLKDKFDGDRQNFAINMEAYFGGDEGLSSLRNVVVSTKGLSSNALKDALEHKLSSNPPTYNQELESSNSTNHKFRGDNLGI